jgi:hypothetical protein
VELPSKCSFMRDIFFKSFDIFVLPLRSFLLTKHKLIDRHRLQLFNIFRSLCVM